VDIEAIKPGRIGNRPQLAVTMAGRLSGYQVQIIGVGTGTGIPGRNPESSGHHRAYTTSTLIRRILARAVYGPDAPVLTVEQIARRVFPIPWVVRRL
jgi:hypothetical protein